MDEMKTTVRTLTFSRNYVPPSPFASKSGGVMTPRLLWERRPWVRDPISASIGFYLRFQIGLSRLATKQE